MPTFTQAVAIIESAEGRGLRAPEWAYAAVGGMVERRIMPGPMFSGRWQVEERLLKVLSSTYVGDARLVPGGPWSVVSTHETEPEARAAMDAP